MNRRNDSPRPAPLLAPTNAETVKKLIATVLFTAAFVLGTAMAAPTTLTGSASDFVGGAP